MNTINQAAQGSGPTGNHVGVAQSSKKRQINQNVEKNKQLNGSSNGEVTHVQLPQSSIKKIRFLDQSMEKGKQLNGLNSSSSGEVSKTQPQSSKKRCLDQSVEKNKQSNGSCNTEGEAPELLEVAQMRYRDFHIKIYKQLTDDIPVKYFYEPILLISPWKIQSQANNVTGEAYVRFTAKMWDEDVEGQVIDWLQKSPGSWNEDEDFIVQPMPYEEIRLIAKGEDLPSTVYSLSDRWRAYDRLPKSFQFYLYCDTKEAADTLAESIRTDPDFMMQDLALECVTSRFAAAAHDGGLYRKRPRLDEDDETMLDSTSDFVGFSSMLSFNFYSITDIPEAVDYTNRGNRQT